MVDEVNEVMFMSVVCLFMVARHDLYDIKADSFVRNISQVFNQSNPYLQAIHMNPEGCKADQVSIHGSHCANTSR